MYKAKLLTPKEVARLLRVNVLTVYDYIRGGNLISIRLGRSYRIRSSDLEKFIISHLVKAKTNQIND